MEQRVKTIKTFETVEEIVNYCSKMNFNLGAWRIRETVQKRALIKYGSVLMIHDPYNLLDEDTKPQEQVKVLKLRKTDLVRWYFTSGSDQEIQNQFAAIGELVFNHLKKNGEIIFTAELILEKMNQDSIPLWLFEEDVDEDEDREIGEVYSNYEIQLI